MQSKTQIVEYFISSAKPFLHLKQFSKLPGIYSVHYYGQSGNLGLIKDLKPGQIIYIGKTLSSQQDRDADTHFKSGKSGSSTVRRSIGALLKKELNLVPIPRGKNRTSKDCINYRFDDKSELILTKWMTENLGLSFLEYSESPEAIRELEFSLIQYICPYLNIESNSNNPFLNELKHARATCKTEAENAMMKAKSPENITTIIKPLITKNNKSVNQTTMHMYEGIWRLVLPTIKESLIKGIESNSIPLSKAQFDAAGNRQSYSFNIQYENGRAVNSLKGSAVARDLDRLIMSNLEIKQLMKSKNIKLKMGTDFVFNIFVN